MHPDTIILKPSMQHTPCGATRSTHTPKDPAFLPRDPTKLITRDEVPGVGSAYLEVRGLLSPGGRRGAVGATDIPAPLRLPL